MDKSAVANKAAIEAAFSLEDGRETSTMDNRSAQTTPDAIWVHRLIKARHTSTEETLKHFLYLYVIEQGVNKAREWIRLEPEPSAFMLQMVSLLDEIAKPSDDLRQQTFDELKAYEDKASATT
jgi:hypothetical protein